MKKISKLFIANRGEIARRIASTAKRMGIRTVLITHQETPPTFLIGVIDEFIKVKEESPSLFLDIERILNIAINASCDAIHPGYGFLSENSEFASRCIERGLIWVGPNPIAIKAMASKAESRDYALKAKVPFIETMRNFPVPSDENGDFSHIYSFVEKYGLPILVKAAYGGGGKGMRLVERKEDIKTAVLRAYSEALNSFGNGQLVVERYLKACRHVEVQVLGDKYSNVVTIGDRDCSVQRRHQKIIEECPAFLLTPKTRIAMSEAAKRLATLVNYDSAGTVEFLVDWSKESQNLEIQKFYFLEMNTRLQVEHPVTEEVFGLDLVELQLKIAQGEHVLENLRIEARGHSVEARIYAEDVFNNYMPAPDKVFAFIPSKDKNTRWEVGIDVIDDIPSCFDPIVAKVIARGSSRESTITTLVEALKDTLLIGPNTNISLLISLLSNSLLKTEPVTTQFLNNSIETIISNIRDHREKYRERAEKLLSLMKALQLDLFKEGNISPENLTRYIFSLNPHHNSEYISLEECYFRKKSFPNLFSCVGKGLFEGMPFFYIHSKFGEKKIYAIQIDGFLFFSSQNSLSHETHLTSVLDTQSEIKAPVPGKVVAIKIAENEPVEEGMIAFIIESMKMQFEIRATKTGKITKINVKENEQLKAGDVLAEYGE